MLERICVFFCRWFLNLPYVTKLIKYLKLKLKDVSFFPDITGFIKNLGRLLFSNRISSLFGTATGVLSARFLGPEEFGKVGLVGNIASFLFIPILMGASNSMYKFLPDSSSVKRKQLMESVLIGNIVASVFWGVVFINVAHFTLRYFHLSSNLWVMGVLYSIVITFYNLSESFLRGQKAFSDIANLKFINSVIFFLLILFLIFIRKYTTVLEYYICNSVSFMIFIFLAIKKAGIKITHMKFSWNDAKRIYSLGVIVMVNMFLTTLLSSIDLFIVNYYYPGYTVGIYNVYQGRVKTLFLVIFYEVFAVVFLPTIAGMDKKLLYKKINKYIYWMLPIVTIGSGAMVMLALVLFGKEYVFDLRYVFIVSISIAVYSIFQMYNCILSMEGNMGALLCLIPLVITVPISLLMQFSFTRYWGILGTMVAVLLSNIMLTLIFKIILYYRYKRT